MPLIHKFWPFLAEFVGRPSLKAHQLLRDPGAGRAFRDIEMKDLASAVLSPDL
jgi:hypothetical protein